MRLIDADSVLRGIDDLRKSPWYNAGKEIGVDPFAHVGFLERREAIQVIVDLCIKKEPTISGWISVNDRMPEKDKDVLVWLYGNYYIARYNKDPDNLQMRWLFEGFNLYEDNMSYITHWMPLPEPPKEKK